MCVCHLYRVTQTVKKINPGDRDCVCFLKKTIWGMLIESSNKSRPLGRCADHELTHTDDVWRQYVIKIAEYPSEKTFCTQLR